MGKTNTGKQPKGFTMTNKKEKNLGGRPPHFKTAQDLKDAIDKYFKDCPDKKNVVLKDSDGSTYLEKVPAYTITGLAYNLGFASRQSFYDYEGEEEFSYIIKRARLFIEKEYEMRLQDGQCTGSIFWLKNSGWSDRQELEHSSDKDNPLQIIVNSRQKNPE